MKKPIFSLEKQIKRVIGARILFASLLLLVIILILTVYDLSIGLDEVKISLNEKLKPLEDFVISQVMINNSQAVGVKLKLANKANPHLKITWEPYNQPGNASIYWVPPFSWQYNYKLGKIAGYDFGYFKISGSFLANKILVDGFVLRIGLLLLFLLTFLLLLYPLAKKIPGKLFIQPINRFLDMASNPADKHQDSKQTNQPIELQELEKRILKLINEAAEKVRNKALIETGEMAAQVAHDIRSPLTSLNVAMEKASALPETQRVLVRSAIQRINDIANNLLSKSREDTSQEKTSKEINSHLLYPIVEAIVSEKRGVLPEAIEFNFNVASNTYLSCAKIQAVEFGRLISNVINNAIEAITASGRVNVSLTQKDEHIIVTIDDTGKGIAAEHLPHIFESGISFEKAQGSGIGLHHTKMCIERWGGNVSLDSEVGQGACLRLFLPLAVPPAWLAQKLIFPAAATIVVLDDDESIHHTWNQRLDAAHQVLHFYTSQTFIDWWKSVESPSQHYFLFDYELINDLLTGLDVIEQYQLGKQATLVTSYYEDEAILQRCIASHTTLLPKGLSGYVPMRWLEGEPDAILIDDNDNLRLTWELAAKLKGKRLYAFATSQAFERIAPFIAKTTPLYIDSSLGGNSKGEELAKTYFEQGYHTIYLATGYEPSAFPDMPWIKAIVGKRPPFYS